MPHECDVCIPCYEMNGKGAEYLNSLLWSLCIQEGVDFGVVVSDQSEDDKVEEVCESYDFVRYHRFEGPRNPCDNLNNALSISDAKVIKIMFQDDLMIPEKDSLHKCVSPILSGNARWSACTCMHTSDGVSLERMITPRYHDQIHYGVNTMSSPSIISILNEDVPDFDNQVSLLLDVDWYKRVHDAYGDFWLIDDPCIVNRLHENSISNTVNKNTGEVLLKEREYIREKYERMSAE